MEQNETSPTQRPGVQFASGMTFTPTSLAAGWAYLVHDQHLGPLGRVVQQRSPDGRWHVSYDATSVSNDLLRCHRLVLLESACGIIARWLVTETGTTVTVPWGELQPPPHRDERTLGAVARPEQSHIGWDYVESLIKALDDRAHCG